MASYIRWFGELSLTEVAAVGGKNASLGELVRELIREGVRVPEGFAITAEAYRDLLAENDLEPLIRAKLTTGDLRDVQQLAQCASSIREAIRSAQLPRRFVDEVTAAYHQLCALSGGVIEVAVRSSATAEDLPSASFAGQQESFLNVRGEEALLRACRNCFASLFTDRAISYRIDQHFDHLAVALSIGVQRMVRSDRACSGVMFSIDTESGLPSVVIINGSYGLGESIVQGVVVPDEYIVAKSTLRSPYRPIIGKVIGSKKVEIVYDERGERGVKQQRVPRELRHRFVLSDDEILTLARWAVLIEKTLFKTCRSTDTDGYRVGKRWHLGRAFYRSGTARNGSGGSRPTCRRAAATSEKRPRRGIGTSRRAADRCWQRACYQVGARYHHLFTGRGLSHRDDGL